MRHVDMLIETLEILETAIDSRDQDKGFEAITILLMQFIEIYGFQGDMFAVMYPYLEELKSKIQDGDFEEANVSTQGLLLKLREVKESVGKRSMQ